MDEPLTTASTVAMLRESADGAEESTECVELSPSTARTIASDLEELHAHRARIAAHAAAHPGRLGQDDVDYIVDGDGDVLVDGDHAHIMAIEIQQRRAADMTPDQIGALRDLRIALPLLRSADSSAAARDALSALDHILARHGATP